MFSDNTRYNNRESRRDFLFHIAAIGAVTGVAGAKQIDPMKQEKINTVLMNDNMNNHIHIKAGATNFEREPLVRPFGFKGGYMQEIWQSAAALESDSGNRAVGLCTQSVLWSDAKVFLNHSEAAGNALMYMMLEYALRRVIGTGFSDPIALLDSVLEDTHEYGKEITGNPRLRKTFSLNALLALDNAAWILYARERGMQTFDDMIPEQYRPGLSYKHQHIASIPLMAYTVPISEIEQAARSGAFVMKIKIGQPGTQEEMLNKDKKRIAAIHKAIGHRGTPHTKDGKIPYYFDANGRYQSKDTLLRLLDFADSIGVLERIAILEEPFPEALEENVGDLGVCVAADESAHTDEDAARRIQMGYGAIAVKAIAKTLSMTLKIVKTAYEHNTPCFCADLTVNPILVDWNKNVAARLAPFPGLGTGLLETNGHQNYKHWRDMCAYHPCHGASWTKTTDGLFHLNEDFYKKSGGIFLPSDHYMNMFHWDNM